MSHSHEDELAQRITELETIAQVSTAVSSILDLDKLLHQILVSTREQFALYHVNLALLDEAGKNLVPVMGDNDMLNIDSLVPSIPMNQQPSIVARVARERKGMMVNNVHIHPDFMPHPLLPDVQAELTLPMVVGDELIGVLDVQSTEVDRFTEEDFRIYMTLAAQIGIAIQNARAYQLLQKRTDELTILNEMSRSLNTTEGINTLLHTFYHYASRLIDTTNFYVTFYEAEKSELVLRLDVTKGHLTWPHSRRKLAHGLVEYVLKTNQPLLMEADVPKRLKELNIQPSTIPQKSWLGVPMSTSGTATGVVAVQSDTSSSSFNENSLRLLVSMVNQVALAVENARLFARIQEQAHSLELEVAERTVELTKTNKQLNSEVKERKQAEQVLKIYAKELERSNQELENFARVASHDLQEPLRKIIAFSDRLEQTQAEALDKRGVDYLNRMQSAATRMQQLITDLLTLSQVTTGRQPFTKIALNQILQEVLADLDFRVTQTEATFQIGSLSKIEADPTQMRQLMQNLISNALKFCRPGVPPVIQITSEVLEKDGRQMCQLMIQDNGIGIEEKYYDRIFETFERLHTRTQVEGTGVGLAICRKIAEGHHGSISVVGVPNESTTFIVCLPVQQS